MPKKNPIIWAITDSKVGHRNQVLGVAEALGHPFEIKEIKYTDFSVLPNFLKIGMFGTSLLGVDEERSDPLKKPWPDIVIAAGRRTAPIVRYIKRKAGKKCFACQIMWPGFPTSGIDLIAVPEHDEIIETRKIITTIGSPHRVTKETLSFEGEVWERTLDDLKKPRIAVLVGGSTAKHKFTQKHADLLAKMVKEMAENVRGSLMITTSRRTDKHIKDTLKRVVYSSSFIDIHFHDPMENKANPYYAFLALADLVVVTGDSISMCSEACASGKPVFIYAPDDLLPYKHKIMHNSLFRRGFASRLIRSTPKNIKEIINASLTVDIEPLNVSGFIAKKINERRK